MADPSGDLQSKLARAIRAVLIDQNAVTLENCYPEPANDVRALPNTTIQCEDGVEFEGPGNWKFPSARLVFRDRAVAQANESEAQPRIDANARLTAIKNALMRSTDGTTYDFIRSELCRLGNAMAVDASNGADPVQVQFAVDNADMADFTCLFWMPGLVSAPTKAADGTYWEREMAFEAVACDAMLSP